MSKKKKNGIEKKGLPARLNEMTWSAKRRWKRENETARNATITTTTLIFVSSIALTQFLNRKSKEEGLRDRKINRSRVWSTLWKPKKQKKFVPTSTQISGGYLPRHIRIVWYGNWEVNMWLYWRGSIKKISKKKKKRLIHKLLSPYFIGKITLMYLRLSF